MDNRLSLIRLLPCLCLWFALWLPGVVCAAPAGVVTHLSGTLSVKHANGSTGTLSVKSTVLEGDELKTEADTYARIKFVDDGEIVMRPNTQMVVNTYAFDAAKPVEDKVAIGLLKGGLRAVTGLIGKRDHDKVKYETMTATIGIRGTHFGALLCQGDCDDVATVTGKAPIDGLHVDVAAGAIVLSNSSGSQDVTVGQFGYVADQHHVPILVPTEEGIRVTMPTSISRNNTHGSGLGEDKDGTCNF